MIRRVLKVGLFLLPVLFLFPNLDAFPFIKGSEFSDLLISHYPNALFLQRTLIEDGSVPLWSPLILSGYPFAANPLSGLFYLPGFWALFFPLPHGINLLVIAHLLWAGAGMYFLLRQEGVGEEGGLFGALAFEGLPKLFSHLGAGHVSLIYAVSWTPWLLFAESRSSNRGSFNAHRSSWLAPGVVLGIIALADIRWAAYSGIFWLAYATWNCWHNRMGQVTVRHFAGWLASMGLKGLLAILIAAPLLLPLVEYSRLSTRSQLTPTDSQYLSLPWGNLFSLIYPAIGGSAEWVLYPGAVVLGLSIYSAASTHIRKQSAYWLVCIPLTLIFALGSGIPFMRFIHFLPGMSLLRVPPRMLFLTGMCLSTLAAYGLDSLIRKPICVPENSRDRSALVLFGVTMFVVMLGVGAWFMLTDPEQQALRVQFAWGSAGLLLSMLIIFASRSNRLAATGAASLLIALSLLDTGALNFLSLEFQSVREVFRSSQEVAEYLKTAGPAEPFRVYSPSYSLPQHAAALYDVELADGVEPLQLAEYSHFMEKATGIESNGYSVTLPSYENGDPAVANRDSLPDARLLGIMNVKYVAAAFPLEVDGFDLMLRTGETWIYQNRYSLPRAWVQESGAPTGTRLIDIPAIDIQPNRIHLTASGPGLLMLSEIVYPGWRASVDGQSQPVISVDGLLRGTRLGPGQHEVIFTFRPILVYVGVMMALITWMGLAFAFIKTRYRHGQ